MSFLLNHTDCNQQKSFYVKQNPKTESVQSGKSVTLQCSLLSKNKENTDQCPGEHSVYWFRAGLGESHPSIIYTQNRSDEREKKSCVYSLSKTIQDTSDTGTYYCAVVTCGEILFGEGAKVEIRQLDPVVFVLGALLVCCVTVIAVLIFYMNRSRVCERCKEWGSRSSELHSTEFFHKESEKREEEERVTTRLCVLYCESRLSHPTPPLSTGRAWPVHWVPSLLRGLQLSLA
ncbi:uncharacterized protein LOC122990118 [Thunnus albacares]|uniref:uncharacterized protein LOC122990118 n=1 Tax=Thunnus albacares TaxID=8236 RepID=UPI001CF705F0|nr:uncharacterized protein LOC122990118 [Thunnus albacares]